MPTNDLMKDLEDSWRDLLNATTPEVRLEAAERVLDKVSPLKEGELYEQ